MSEANNADLLTSLSSIAIWNALNANSPGPVGSIPAITCVMSWATKKWFIHDASIPGVGM